MMSLCPIRGRCEQQLSTCAHRRLLFSGVPKSAAFWIDARVLGIPSMTDSWVSELSAARGRVRYIYPLDTVVTLPPLLSPTVRRCVGLVAPDDIVGST